jgi:hypothetical protein
MFINHISSKFKNNVHLSNARKYTVIVKSTVYIRDYCFVLNKIRQNRTVSVMSHIIICDIKPLEYVYMYE